jgi:hypothetical protein
MGATKQECVFTGPHTSLPHRQGEASEWCDSITCSKTESEAGHTRRRGGGAPGHVRTCTPQACHRLLNELVLCLPPPRAWSLTAHMYRSHGTVCTCQLVRMIPPSVFRVLCALCVWVKPVRCVLCHLCAVPVLRGVPGAAHRRVAPSPLTVSQMYAHRPP